MGGTDKDLAGLPIDAIHAVKSMAEFACDLPGAGPSDWNIVLHHLLRLASEKAELIEQTYRLGEELAKDKLRAERAEAELAALKEKYQQADGMTACVECMGRGSWWFGVYRDRTELFNSGEQQYPISLTTGKMARACAECVMEVLRER